MIPDFNKLSELCEVRGSRVGVLTSAICSVALASDMEKCSCWREVSERSDELFKLTYHEVLYTFEGEMACAAYSILGHFKRDGIKVKGTWTDSGMEPLGIIGLIWSAAEHPEKEVLELNQALWQIVRLVPELPEHLAMIIRYKSMV